MLDTGPGSRHSLSVSSTGSGIAGLALAPVQLALDAPHDLGRRLSEGHGQAKQGLERCAPLAALEDAHRFCERTGNARYLLTSAPGDALRTDGSEAARLARLLGYVHQQRRPAR
jgi:hypothetical protein